MLAVAGGDGVHVRPWVWIGVQGQCSLQQPEQQGKDTGGSSSTSSQLCCRRLFYFFSGCSSQGHSNTNKTKKLRKSGRRTSLSFKMHSWFCQLTKIIRFLQVQLAAPLISFRRLSESLTPSFKDNMDEKSISNSELYFCDIFKGDLMTNVSSVKTHNYRQTVLEYN